MADRCEKPKIEALSTDPLLASCAMPAAPQPILDCDNAELPAPIPLVDIPCPVFLPTATATMLASSDTPSVTIQVTTTKQTTDCGQDQCVIALDFQFSIPAGPVGPQGPIGPTGPTGPAGPIGPVGPAGPIGPVGPAGPVGPVGPAGPAGPPGDDGGDDGGESGSGQLPFDPSGIPGGSGGDGTGGDDGSGGTGGNGNGGGSSGGNGGGGDPGDGGDSGDSGSGNNFTCFDCGGVCTSTGASASVSVGPDGDTQPSGGGPYGDAILSVLSGSLKIRPDSPYPNQLTGSPSSEVQTGSAPIRFIATCGCGGAGLSVIIESFNNGTWGYFGLCDQIGPYNADPGNTATSYTADLGFAFGAGSDYSVGGGRVKINYQANDGGGECCYDANGSCTKSDNPEADCVDQTPGTDGNGDS